jgi:hypothetical protein
MHTFSRPHARHLTFTRAPALNFGRLRCAALLLWLGPLALLAQAQTFKLECEAEGVIAQLDNKKLPPAKVSIEIQNIGWHMYFNVVGPPDYQMRVSSLITEQYQGANLSNASRLGASKKNKSNGHENQILIDRATVSYTGYNDVEQRGKLLRIAYEGKCKLPN